MTATASAALPAPAEILATPPDVEGHPLVRGARRLAVDLLAPGAQRVDVEGVPRSHLDALAAAGLFGAVAPVDVGGAGAPAAAVREVTEVLSGACGSTWFVQTQHALPLATVTKSPYDSVREQWLRPLATGASLAGIGVAHVRRPGPPALSARPAGDGWVLDGTVGWCTGWGVLDVVLLAAQTPDDRLLFVLLPAVEQPGLRASAPLPLAAMNGTHTVRLDLDDVHCGPETVVDLVDRERWLDVDAAKTANVTPAVFGLLRAVLDALHTAGARRGAERAADVAVGYAREAAPLRAEAYHLIDDVPAAESIARRLELRAHALELTVRASAALVAAGAGGALSLDAPAQRWAREALFHLVQAQTAPVRDETLRRYAALAIRPS